MPRRSHPTALWRCPPALLVRRLEQTAVDWGFHEILLQVEEENLVGRSFYRALGYVELFTDPASRRYDATSFFLRNVRTSKMTLRKELPENPGEVAPLSLLSAAIDQMRAWAVGGKST